ncbi:MAG: PDZ domain-containing protein [Actinomycetota bacterium]
MSALLLAALAGPALAQDDPEGQPGIGIGGFTAPDGRGAGISTVVPGYPADEAGLRIGDIITEVDGTEISSIEELAEALGNYEAGDTVSLAYERGTDSRTVDVTLRSLPGSTRGSPPPLFGGNEGFRGEAQPEPEPQPSDVGYLPVIFVFGVLITGFLGTLVILRLKDRKKAGSGAGIEETGTPLEVARMRYARGEVTQEQFRTIAADLGDASAAETVTGDPAAETTTEEAGGEEKGGEEKGSG